ncbi:relaxase/mobilization nuclease domain-containing protein [Rhizobium pusense]|jgi:type IV secretion system T-DNA border endonuclease VirD2|nr:relaxase/mobilization nuclease domain-containing protein [Agrobacterium pusense]MDH0873380.1 relaxase/mobilization nuclease domain-containing protein [Agrobacterium pusense]MDH2091979.1 relaxase/mobilization nuclease domain-containing protein [Agrobacterium pusense]
MKNDPKVRALYDDFYKGIGVSAAWLRNGQMRMYRDQLPQLMAALKKSPDTKAKLARVVSKAPEVMVKISGRTKDGDHLKQHMDYITRNGKVEAETDYGPMMGKEAVRDLHADWADDEVVYKGQHQVRKTSLSVNMVLSMPPGVDRSQFRDAVRDFVDKEIRSRADVMVAFHDDTNHPHAHVTVRGRQHNGKAFNPGKAVLSKYREQFAEALRHRGIEAEATPRFARGRSMKSDRQEFRHMRGRGLTPRNEKRAMEQAYKELARGGARTSGAARREGQGARERPWEQAAQAKNAGVKMVYRAAARELASSTSVADRQLALKVEAFAQSIPEPRFQRDMYLSLLAKQIRDHSQSKTVGLDREAGKPPESSERGGKGPERGGGGRMR